MTFLLRLLAGVLLGVAALSVAFEAWQSVDQGPTWVLEKRARFRQSRPWEWAIELAIRALAVLLILALLSVGFQRLVGPVFGLGSSLSSDSDELPIGAVCGVVATILLAAYVAKVRALATRVADLEEEIESAKLAAPLDVEWGETWTKKRDALQEQLVRLEADSAHDQGRAAVIRAALARAAKSAWRGSTDNVVVPRSEWNPRTMDVREGAAEIAKLVGKRVASFTFSLDGAHVQIEFTDRSCFVLPRSGCLLEGHYYQSLVAALERLLEQKALPDPEKLRVLSFDAAPDERAFNESLLTAFLQAWSRAQPSREYVKADWKRLDDLLTRLGMHIGQG